MKKVDGEISVLLKLWGINTKKIIALTEGSAKCFIIEDGSDRYFFKIYQEKFNPQTVANEISVCNYLTKKGFFVSTFIPTNQGTYIEKMNGKLCTVQKYIDGTTFQKFEVPKVLLFDSARVLANINIALEELPVQLPLGFDQQWLSEWSKEPAINKYHNLLAQLNAGDENYNKIAMDFKNKCEIISAFNPAAFPFSSLTVENTHGDYNVLQLIFSEDRVKAVIDFSSCARLPICWELIRSYSLSSAECRNGRIDIDNFVGYVREYMKIKKLKKEDLELMPYFYLFSLIRSSFGYKGYIEKKRNGLLVDQKDTKTLEFAFWRTAMAKWLFEHEDVLYSELKKCW